MTIEQKSVHGKPYNHYNTWPARNGRPSSTSLQLNVTMAGIATGDNYRIEMDCD